MSTGVPYDYDSIWRHAYGDMQALGPVHRHMRRLCELQLRDLDYTSVLDVGCGAGHNLPLLSDGRRVEIGGLDISPEALGRARGFWPGGQFTEADIQADRLDGTWDLVFSSLVLEHLPDDEAALRNMRAMAGRYLLVTTIAGVPEAVALTARIRRRF